MSQQFHVGNLATSAARSSKVHAKKEAATTGEVKPRASVFGAESAIRPDSLQRACTLGLLCRLLAMDVVDAEGLDDGAEGEDKTRGNGR